MTEYINKSKALHEMWQRLYAIEDKLEKEHGLDVCERHDVQIGFEAGLRAIVNMPAIDIVHDDGWVCVNDRSDYCTDWTDYEDTCEDWEERE